jgi:hypothetical protein
VRAKSNAEALKKAWLKLLKILGDDFKAKSYADPEGDFYRCIRVSAERAELWKFFNSVSVDQVGYVWSSMVGSNRKISTYPLTSRNLKSLLTGTGGKVTRFLDGITILESKYNSLTGKTTHVSHDLIVRQ